MKDKLPARVQNTLLGFAAGVMVAASVWSLLIPSINMGAADGKMAVVPAVIGFSIGIAFLYLLDQLTPHLHLGAKEAEGLPSRISRTAMLALAVTLHNIPEGMAVGVVFAGAMGGSATMSLAGATALAIGIAIQNFPEGAIISMPMRAEGNGKWRSFLIGTLSGLVEPIGAIVTIVLASHIIPLMPYFLSFAGGAMIYVVVEELIPESSTGPHSNLGTLGFAFGFVLMMVLDVVFG
jgi:ZIP family zinc transporter